LITFTTTLGRIEPAEARTSNGQVRVRLIAGNQSGVATVTAFSGGASGKIENLRVGSAAVERVLLSASPQTLGASGGTTVITARVEDVSGAGVPNVPVTFTADVGSLSAATASTDANGTASVSMTTTRQAVVTANVAGKTAQVTVQLNPRTGLTLTAPTTTITALQPASFTVAVTATSNIRDVRIAWGDGSSQALGALAGSTTVSHIYQEAGTYTVTATATDASGFTEAVSTSVTVLPAQPPSVIVSATPSNAALNQTVVVRAQVQGNSSAIIRYEWNFDTGAVPQTAVTTGNQVTVSWATLGTKIIFVRAFQASGPSGDGFGSVNVSTTGGGTPVQGSK
jgi:adhesin/invasin